MPSFLFRLLAFVGLLCGLSPALRAATYTLDPATGFGSLPATLQAGDEIVLKDGTYLNVIRTLKAAGTEAAPVVMRAENPGRVFFGGGVQFKIQGTWMIISGLTFDGDVVAGGPGYPSGIFRFDANSSDCTLRDCRFNNFDAGADPVSGTTWLYLAGFRHTIEYCSFAHKVAPDPLITISPDEDQAFTAGTRAPTQDVPRHHRIRYCYFGERTNIGENGYEIVRLAEGKFINFAMTSTVEHCLFERAIYRAGSGEPEIISNKSCANIYRHNTFIDCRGGIVLRAGDDCLVEGNFFFAEPGSPLGSGIRVIGQRHIVRNNYLQDVDGTELNAAICVMKGSGGWSDTTYSSGYESANDAKIYHNTLVDCTSPLAIGVTTGDPSKGGTVAPTGVIVANNLIQSSATDGAALFFNDANSFALAAVTFAGNQAWHAAGTYGGTSTGALPAGFATGTPVLLATDAALGYAVPASESPALGAAVATSPATRRDLRGLVRPALGADVGAHDRGATGPAIGRPLARGDVGAVFEGRTQAARAPRFTSFTPSSALYAGNPVTLSVALESDLAATLQWFKDDAPVAGATGASLAFAAVQPADSGSYLVIATSAAGATTSFPIKLTVLPSAPEITAQPVSRLANAGSTVTFSVAALGQPPLGYQWFKDGLALPGETAATLTLADVQPSAVGAYTVEVTNGLGQSVLSQAADLTLPGGTLLLNDTFSGSGFKTQELPGSAHWYSSSTSSSGNLALNSGALLVPGGRHALAYFTASGAQALDVGDSLAVTFTLNFTTVGTSSGGFRLGFFNSNGATRATDGDNASFGSYDGYIATTTAQYPDSSGATSGTLRLMQRLPGTANTTLISSTNNIYTSVAAFSGNSQSFVAGQDYTATFAVTRTTASAVRVDFRVTGGALVDYGFTAGATANLVTAFDSFAILSTSSNGSSYKIDNVAVEYTPAPPAVAPEIVTPPQSATVIAGGDFTLSVTATGTPDPTYQWRHKGAPIEGATRPAFTRAAAQLADAGTYDVVVTNAGGSVTSTPVTVTVITAMENWRLAHFGRSEATGPAADLADPDADGLVNLVEYALGLAPLEVDTAAAPATTAADGYWLFLYPRPVDRADIAYAVEVTSDLANWMTSGVEHEQVSVVGQTAVWRARYPQADAPRLFFRLRITPVTP